MRPSALAVLRLITSSNVVGCSTGMSAGFFPAQDLGGDRGSAPDHLGVARSKRDRQTGAYHNRVYGEGQQPVLIAKAAIS